MLTRGEPCARGCSFDWAWWCDGPWARSLDDRTSSQFLPPNRNRPTQRAVGSIARSTPPVGAAAPNSLSCLGRSCLGRSCSASHRVARHGLYDCSRRRPPHGQDRREGPDGPSKIERRLSEKDTGLI